MNDIQRSLISASLTATMAYLATDGLSAITEEEIETIQRRNRIRRAWEFDSDHNIRQAVQTFIAVKWENIAAINAMLTSPGIDLDIFEISEEDSHNSLDRRNVGWEHFGYEFISQVDAADAWLDDQHNHGGWDTTAKRAKMLTREFCRIDQCSLECLH